jgi:hypothetical protein
VTRAATEPGETSKQEITVTKHLTSILIGGALAVALSAGCASTPPRSNEALAHAHTAVEEADRAGAGEFAPQYLEAARSKLARADQEAAHSGATESVSRLADEAAADAQLASARSRAKKARLAADQVGKGVEALKTEAERPST